MFTAKVFLETRSFMHLSKHVFGSQQVSKYLSYEARSFFQNVQNLMQILKKYVFSFKIFALEVGVVNCRH